MDGFNNLNVTEAGTWSKEFLDGATAWLRSIGFDGFAEEAEARWAEANSRSTSKSTAGKENSE